uniref:alpha-glucosidase C-terminal domain-containing protein n=1 Tax=uncultured Faecalicoccus sp. TaxID=1971760 RepID=UPI0026243AA4
VYAMKSPEETLWIAINLSDQNVEVSVPYQGQGMELLSNVSVDIDHRLTLEPYSSQIIKL